MLEAMPNIWVASELTATPYVLLLLLHNSTPKSSTLAHLPWPPIAVFVFVTKPRRPGAQTYRRILKRSDESTSHCAEHVPFLFFVLFFQVLINSTTSNQKPRVCATETSSSFAIVFGPKCAVTYPSSHREKDRKTTSSAKSRVREMAAYTRYQPESDANFFMLSIGYN